MHVHTYMCLYVRACLCVRVSMHSCLCVYICDLCAHTHVSLFSPWQPRGRGDLRQQESGKQWRPDLPSSHPPAPTPKVLGPCTPQGQGQQAGASRTPASTCDLSPAGLQPFPLQGVWPGDGAEPDLRPESLRQRPQRELVSRTRPHPRVTVWSAPGRPRPPPCCPPPRPLRLALLPGPRLLPRPAAVGAAPVPGHLLRGEQRQDCTRS